MPNYFEKVKIQGYNGTNWQPVRTDASTRSLQTMSYDHHEIHGGSHFYVEGYATLGVAGTLYVKLETPDTTKWSHFLWEIGSSGILTATLDEDATGGMAGGARTTIHANNRNVKCWTGRHTGANNAAILTDSTQSWTAKALIGYQVFNSLDGSSGFITDNTANTVTATLAGGTDNDWDTADEYEINQSTMILTSGVTACTDYIQRISGTQFGSKGSGGTHDRGNEIILKQNTVYCRNFVSATATNYVTFKASWYQHEDKTP